MGVQLTAIEEVDNRVSGVALRVDVALRASDELCQDGSNGGQDEGKNERGDHDVKVHVGHEANIDLAVDDGGGGGEQGQERDESVQPNLVTGNGRHDASDGQE